MAHDPLVASCQSWKEGLYACRTSGTCSNRGRQGTGQQGLNAMLYHGCTMGVIRYYVCVTVILLSDLITRGVSLGNEGGITHSPRP
jgi:hypothetical protein